MKYPFICSGCGEHFAAIGSFTKHRYNRGPQEHPKYGRHCMTVAEMTGAGWSHSDGVWRTPVSDEQRARLKEMWSKKA